MGEAQRAGWLLSMPACADINNAMVDLSGVGFHTSDQHKEVSHARKERDRIVKAGEEMLLILYGGISNENLDILRYHRFASKVAVGNVCVQVHTLPPTSAAAKFHSMRAFLQCQCWIGAGDGLNPNDWGWYTLDNKLLPLK